MLTIEVRKFSLRHPELCSVNRDLNQVMPSLSPSTITPPRIIPSLTNLSISWLVIPPHVRNVPRRANPRKFRVEAALVAGSLPPPKVKTMVPIHASKIPSKLPATMRGCENSDSSTPFTGTTKRVPQFEQNLASPGFSAPHLEHIFFPLILFTSDFHFSLIIYLLRGFSFVSINPNLKH